MDLIWEDLLQEIDYLEKGKKLYGKVKIDHFRVSFRNQQSSPIEEPLRYYAKKNNIVEVELKLLIDNPFTGQKARFCYVELLAYAKILSKGKDTALLEYADKDEVDLMGMAVSDYVKYLIVHFFKRNNSDVQTWNCLYIIQNMEHALYGSLF